MINYPLLMIDFDFDKECYGCGLCESVCPTHAIRMVENQEGFLVPLVDASVCVRCGKCERSCIRLRPHDGVDVNQSDCYAYWLNDIHSRMESTSGGAFYALGRTMIEDWGGVVCGCVWNESMEAEIISADNMETLRRMQGSKYVQSRIRCYDTIKKNLADGRKVLFTGTPCQVGAVQRCFPKSENLYTAALFCEHVASPLVWKKRVSEMEAEYGAPMTNAGHRRTGCYGWLLPMAEYTFANGKTAQMPAYSVDPYVRNMIYGFFTRPACYQCGYKGKFATADIQMGDFWGLSKQLMKQTENKGCSALIVNTDKGRTLFRAAGLYATAQKSSYRVLSANNPALLHAFEPNTLRNKLMAEVRESGFGELVAKYCCMNNKKTKYMKILHFLRVAGIVKRALYHYSERI